MTYAEYARRLLQIYDEDVQKHLALEKEYNRLLRKVDEDRQQALRELDEQRMKAIRSIPTPTIEE